MVTNSMGAVYAIKQRACRTGLFLPVVVYRAVFIGSQRCTLTERSTLTTQHHFETYIVMLVLGAGVCIQQTQK